MAKTRVELNRAGVRSLLRSEKMKELLKARADMVVNACGHGYEAGSYVMPTRAVSRVSAVTMEARLDNLKNNTILKALK